MNKKPHITIGIPAYNEEANIGKLLKNLLAQKKKNFALDKIIVVSDASKDDTANIVKSVKSNRVQLIEGRNRIGQCARQNQIIDELPKSSDYLLILEADTLPATEKYIENMINRVPANHEFSMVVGSASPQEANNIFEQIMRYGFFFRKNIFECSLEFPNLYLSNGQAGRLFSRQFLTNFKWHKNMQDDSYSYRKAIESSLPILRSKKAKIYFKSVENLGDYFTQSGKFQKARKLESKHSNVYRPKVSYLQLAQTISRQLIFKPHMLVAYLFVSTLSRVNSLFLSGFSYDWKSFSSSKALN